jgi:multidrug efflux pump subunit AcrA (membrane-fusion protein)
MTAAVRVAELDTVAPPLHLAACGAVAVDGLSPARTELAAHIAQLARLTAKADSAGRPVARLIEQSTQATAELTKAEAALAVIDAAHSARLVEAARANTGPTEPVESEAAEAALSRARRACASVKMALDEVRREHDRANAELEAAKVGFDDRALCILLEEHHAHLEHWAKARDEFYREEAALLGLHAALGQHGRNLEGKTPGAGLSWLRQLEALHPPWSIAHGHIELGPREVNAAASQWAAMLDRLKADASATF